MICTLPYDAAAVSAEPRSTMTAAHGASSTNVHVYAERRLTSLKVRFVPKFVPRSQAYYWTKAWLEGELEADEDIRIGRLKRFETAGEVIAALAMDEEDEE